MRAIYSYRARKEIITTNAAMYTTQYMVFHFPLSCRKKMSAMTMG